MKVTRWVGALAVLLATSVLFASAQAPAPQATDDPVRTLVGRLDLERYKATIKGLTQFGDRRQGTDRNRAATDWIDAQLKSYGCTNTERITYEYTPQPRTPPAGLAPAPPKSESTARPPSWASASPWAWEP